MLTDAPSWIGESRHVLVVAPHPDDDVIGCGGLLYGLARAGVQPTMLYVTDGSASHPNSVRFPRARLAKMRENEARAALRELGVATAPIFLGMRDGTLAGSDREHYVWLVEQIAQSIASYDIDIVLGPWAHDPHGDHVATARAITNAVASTSRSVRVLYYVVWAPIRSSIRERRMLTRHVAIEVTLDEDQVNAKKRALLCHRTQTSGLIDDDPHGFRIDDTLMHAWLRPAETLYARAARGPIRTTTGGSL